MIPDGLLTPSFGWLVGVGPGAGISLLFIFMGLVGISIGWASHLFGQIRNVETILQDHDDAQIPANY